MVWVGPEFKEAEICCPRGSPECYKFLLIDGDFLRCPCGYSRRKDDTPPIVCKTPEPSSKKEFPPPMKSKIQQPKKPKIRSKTGYQPKNNSNGNGKKKKTNKGNGKGNGNGKGASYNPKPEHIIAQRRESKKIALEAMRPVLVTV